MAAETCRNGGDWIMAELCKVCGTGPYKNMGAHMRGPTHQANLRKGSVVSDPTAWEQGKELAFRPIELDPDLQAIVDAVGSTPQVRGRMTRVAFSTRGWPNDEHPETVRDFMEAHNIPCIYVKVKA